MSDRVLFTVTEPDGNVIARTVDTSILGTLTPTELAAAEWVFACMLITVAEELPHVHPADRPAVIGMWLLRQAHDEAAYRRICEQRGLLPL